MDDQMLTTLLRGSNPARTRADAPLTLRQRMMLERLMAERSVRRRWTWGRMALALSLPLTAMVVVLMVAIAVIQPFGATPASAYGPAPLEYASTGQSMEQVVQDAQQRLAATAGVPVALRQSTTTAWNVNIDETGEPEQTVAISPTVTELVWNEDLSGRWIVRTGAPFAAAGGELVPQKEALPEGSVIDDQVFAAGEYPANTPDAGEWGAEQIADLVTIYTPDPSFAGDAFMAANDLQTEWTLSDAQQADFLQALLVYDSLTVAGETTDRLGRAVIGLQGDTSAKGQQTTLLLSMETGRIVGMETVVTADGGAMPVPVGTVISYALWKDAS